MSLGGNSNCRPSVCLGAGTEGWIAGVDPDLVEESNLPRIPYASREHVGSPKVTVAAQFAGRKNPEVKSYPFPCTATEDAVLARIKEATVIFGAGDNDGLRKVANEHAVRNLIPYIDLGCDIQAEGDRVQAGGQVRVVLPGENACLVCCGGFDPSAAALDLMDDERKAAHAARGYVINSEAEATPSVANLNATVAQLAISAFLALVHGRRFGVWDYAHFDQFTAEVTSAASTPLETCPLCGPEGALAMGDWQPTPEPQMETDRIKVEAAP